MTLKMQTRGLAYRELRAAVAISALIAAWPAMAQSTPSTPQTSASTPDASPETAQASGDAAPAPSGSDIVVTGSRIAPPNAVSIAPIISVSGDSLIRSTGSVSIGDKLNDLPNFRSTFSTQNSTQYLGTHGLNLIDLYGLGTQRTLVLVNGRRHVGADILNNGVSVDINSIPNGLLDRVDQLTGGASSVYGSDAIAGVVNFVLKDNFDGLTANIRSGTSTYGDAGSYLATLTAGKNFAEGRGNIAVDLEYAHQNDFYGSQRPNTRSVGSFVTVQSDPEGSVNGSDGTPDRRFFNDVRSTTYSLGGLVGFASRTGACGRDGNGAAYRCTYLFQPDGSLVPQTGTRVGLAPNGSFVGGNGMTGREGQQLVLQPQQNRYVANLVGHFEVSPAIVPFVEAKYVRVDTRGSQSGPAFFNGTTFSSLGYGATAQRIRLDNPYLSDQARSLITSQLVAGGTDPSTITGATRFSLAKRLLDLGVRDENDRRETWRVVGGVRGDLGDGFRYELSGNYGEMTERTLVLGNLNVQRYLLAQDSVRNAAGNIVCRAQVTPAAAALAALNGGSSATLAADVAACQPLNPFGTGNISQAARNYVVQDTTSRGKITQLDISGFIAGDTSKWFELPGGPIAFSVGGEYRRETNFFQVDPLIQQGYTFYNALATLSAPAFAVKEAFAEVRVPLLKDLPFVKELTITGSGRVSDYRGSAGTVWTYNAGGDYAPTEDFRVRATYARAVRAPNITELYAAQGQNFALVDDPCSARNIATGSTNRVANCRAAGIPASYDYVYTQSLLFKSGGNPNLTAEKSDSFTAGGVLTPRWIPGLTVSADYYSIKVKNVISSIDAQTILDQCYDSASLNNVFCTLFKRAPASGGPNGEEANRIIEGSLLQSQLNFASLKARGVNVSVNYQRNLGEIGALTLGGVYTHVIQRDDFLNPADPDRADRIRGELGSPIDAFNASADLKHGPVSIGYTMRYIGHMTVGSWEDTHSVQGRPPENADYAERQFYPAIWYHDLRLSVDANEHFNLFGGVDNMLNTKAPYGLSGVGDGSGIYDVRGRYLYVGARVKL